MDYIIHINTILLTFIALFFKKRQPKEVPFTFCVKNKLNEKIINNIQSLQLYTPSIICKSGMVQTLIQQYLMFTNVDYEIEYIMTSDNETITLDWKYCKDKSKPLILCLHGLGGNSKSPYLKTFVNHVTNSNYNVVIYNRRRHTKNNEKGDGVPFPKHVNMEDMELVVSTIKKKYPKNVKFLVGFSAGANLAIKYIFKHHKDFLGTVSISNGYNIYDGLKMLTDKSINTIVVNFLKNLITSQVEKDILRYNSSIDIDKVKKAKTVIEFEESLLVPLYNYKNLKSYYNDCSCHKVIKNIKSHLLCLCSCDDPFIPSDLINIPINACAKNKNIITVVTKSGGHIGWIETGGSWYINVILEYFEQLKNIYKYE
jgi:predicted alpha/beta-fold hydrolase